MNFNKQGVLGTILVFVLMTVVLCCVCYCSPVSYREDIVEVTTTPKTYRDHFPIKLEHKTKTKTVPPNESFADNGEEEPPELSFGERNRELENDIDSRVKSVMPGEKTLRQSDEEDDDDDDGGEYEGFDYSRDDKSNKKKLQQCAESRPGAAGAMPMQMPMMIIREVDMVAVQIPVKGPADKSWSEWSPCSRPCRGGKGLQSRWRVQDGVQGKEQQFRPCFLADCGSRDFQFRPSYP